MSVVLLALVGVLLAMWVVIMADKQKMEDMKTALNPKHPVPLAALDLSRQEAVLDRLKQAPSWNFLETNKLFNPVQWQRNNGRVVKIENSRTVGDQAVTVIRIIPLYFAITLNSVDTNGL
ncbi:MAG TPA: hypothetical protein VN516_05595, partial [Candidatus Baltobacteraceae bacterium]|nr:hypothetical protein [Candidatus Baltobacteraceae bacterium]